MNGFWKYFWTIYTLFFAIPFPMLIYYNASYGVDGEDTGPWLALTYLLLSIIAWGLVIWNLFSSLVLTPFRQKKAIQYLLDNGVSVEGVILESEKKGQRSNGSRVQSITFSLRNFSGAEIREAMDFVDTRPEERRYEPGKKVMLRVDREMKRQPSITLEASRPTLRMGRIFLFILVPLALSAAVAWYYVFSYELQSNGSGWRFMVFYHPLMLCPLILLATRFGFGKLISLFTGNPEKQLVLKYHGRRTDAEVVSVAQTGTYINEQPQMRFELRYTDDHGQTHSTTLKRIVPLLEMNIAQSKTLPIFYLMDKPGEVALAQDVDG